MPIHHFMIDSMDDGLSPFSYFLLLLSVKTFATRIDGQQATARRKATHEFNFSVFYPGEIYLDGGIHGRISYVPGTALSSTMDRFHRAFSLPYLFSSSTKPLNTISSTDLSPSHPLLLLASIGGYHLLFIPPPS